MVAPTLVLAVVSLVIAVSDGPLHDHGVRAATGLIDPHEYLEAVRQPEGLAR